ncbi:putative oxidoreductase [Medicago truncatula]|uniref:D-arabinono-1,4-lactone oxidase family protein, putative n=1 Tax=Medicago truncatula TaxID=3880 RepID=A0A072VI66_MEDTR|nr:D-arabinono-1,4-lactone oxidase family protein, putative [Medicago truncatula]RHN78997.1 putative oxidoreductase [Medicago truncatula]
MSQQQFSLLLEFGDFINYVKKLRNINPQNFCGIDIYNGILIRYIKASEVYLGQSEDSVVIDFNYYRANDQFPARLNQDVWEKLEQIAFSSIVLSHIGIRIGT